jgi:hypothetical protein
MYVGFNSSSKDKDLGSKGDSYADLFGSFGGGSSGFGFGDEVS